MNTQYVLTGLFALCAVAGCALNSEPPSENQPNQAPQAGKLPEAPAPKAKPGRENWPQLLVGTWKRVTPKTATEVTIEFAANGIATMRMSDIEGVRTRSVSYRLVDDTFVVPEPKVEDNVITQEETSESTTYIESLTEDKLVTMTVVRKRFTPAWAAELAKSRGIPVEQLLAEVREARHPATYERVKDK